MNGKRAKALRRLALAERKDTVTEMKQRSAQISPSTIKTHKGWIVAFNEVSTNVQGQPPVTDVCLYATLEEALPAIGEFLGGTKIVAVPD